jgi:hypothetical protein
MAIQHTPTMSIEQMDQLRALLQKEKGYYDSIWDITQQEAEKLQRGRPLTETINLLKKKKILVTCIEEIESMIKPLRELWMQHHSDCALAIEIRALIKQLDEQLKQTLDLDKKNQILMQQALNALKRQQAQASDR